MLCTCKLRVTCIYIQVETGKSLELGDKNYLIRYVFVLNCLEAAFTCKYLLYTWAGISQLGKQLKCMCYLQSQNTFLISRIFLLKCKQSAA